MTGTAVALVVLGYLSGSVPYGLLLVRALKGVDVRAQGSGNIGATNVGRVAGPVVGVGVLALDALKGALPVLLARAVAPGSALPVWVGLGAFVGHVAPVWLGFRGGKGVATALGVLAVLAPWAAVAGAVTYAGVFALFRVSSVGSLLGGLAAVAVTWLLPGTSRPAAWLTTALFALLLWTHRGNLGRLLRRAEPRV
jgi:glycerol-3-phosphate acyltransferase PlsY